MSDIYVDFSEMPAMFGRCMNSECPMGVSCLRRMAMLREETRTDWLTVVNPAAVESVDDCSFYIDAYHPTHAKGLAYNLRDVPLGKAEAIKHKLESKFGRMKLSRMKRGLCVITPQEQELLAKIFANYGATAPSYAQKVHPWELG